MWIVYNKETLTISNHFYSKKTAQEFIKMTRQNKKHFGLDKIDVLDTIHIEKWKIWKALSR